MSGLQRKAKTRAELQTSGNQEEQEAAVETEVMRS